MRDYVRDLILGALELIALTVIAVTHALPGEAVASLFSLSIGIRALQARNAGAGGAGGAVAGAAAGAIAGAGLLSLVAQKGAQFLHLRTARALALASLCLSLVGCVGWQPPPAVELVAQVANRATPALVALEEAQGDAAIAAHPGDPAGAAAALLAVESDWQPFWNLWGLFSQAQASAAASRERGASDADQAEAAAVSALCNAQGALPAGVPSALLEVEGIACAVAEGATK